MALTPDDMDALVKGLRQINGRLDDAGIELVVRQAGADLTGASLLAAVRALVSTLYAGSAAVDVAERVAKLREREA